jgi:hypothetical protein
MTLHALFQDLSKALTGQLPIERVAREVLAASDGIPAAPYESVPLPDAMVAAMMAADANSVCKSILSVPLPWAPPTTSKDLAYIVVGKHKTHVELIGPEGLVRSDACRLGLYGMLPHGEYGIRTHPAEEFFFMLAGMAAWKKGDAPYSWEGPGATVHHPSMLPHATRTGGSAFMSLYAWVGDISTDGYVYRGLPGDV